MAPPRAQKVPADEKVLSGVRNIPRDYTFVKKGDPYMTRNCRTATHATQRTVYRIQHASSGAGLGIACPTTIVSQVSASAAATAEERRAAVAAKDRRDEAAAAAALARLFPNMPAHHAAAVRGHAFRKGSGRVGRACTSLSEDERVQRAVVAHVRHTCTEYDAILKKGAKAGRAQQEVREEARRKVKDVVDGVLRSWAGDEGGDAPAHSRTRNVGKTRVKKVVKRTTKRKSAPAAKTTKRSAAPRKRTPRKTG